MFRQFRENTLVSQPKPEVQTTHDDLVKIHKDDHSSDEEFAYADVDLQNLVGKQIIMWSHKMPETLALYTPLAGDNLLRMATFAISSLQYDRHNEKLMVLKPKRKRPVNILDIYRVKHGSCIFIVPKCDPTITLEAKQLNAKFDLVLSVATTVGELKQFLHNQKGYPTDRIELLYKDTPLVNTRHLFEYKIGHKSRLFVMLHLYYDILVHIECFWGQTYHIYVDPCMTSTNIIYTALKRTVGPDIKNVMALFELYLPKHTLVVYHKKNPLKWHECLGMYQIKDGSTLTLTTVGMFNKLALQTIPVTMDDGVTNTVSVSQFDCWSTVALKIHGITRLPMNLIRLYKSRKEIDFSETVGGMWNSGIGPHIMASISQAQIDPDTLYGLELNIILGTGISEYIRCAANRKIKTVKKRLQEMGVPNASVYDIYADGTKLPNDGKIADVMDDTRIPLSLKLKSYPIFIHSPKTIIYKMFAHAHESLATFKVRIQMKTGLSIKHYDLLISGELITAGDDTPVFDTNIAIKTSIFLIPKEKCNTFIVIANDWLIKLKIPTNPIYKQIKDILWKEAQIPDGSLYSITTFLLWFYQKTDKRKEQNSKSRKMYNPLAIEGPQATMRQPEYQDYQVKELRQDKHNKSLIVVHGGKNPPKSTFPYKPGVIDMDTAALLSLRQ
ncbi:uncharacterized protein LOC126824701 [Patella vulgata]|uniref:uncharacterized protein LOC126824701 n=1 Tax=Patella vulgata TaxID=6465 RepID=UPI0024A96679|nr:uncharacterized protein LOC126824701 [Patella vulgata]